MPVKFTALVLSVSLASPMILGDKLHHTLAEPPHTHELPRFPGQTVSVTSPAVSGSNVTSQSHSVDVFIAGADLVLPLDGLTGGGRSSPH